MDELLILVSTALIIGAVALVGYGIWRDRVDPYSPYRMWGMIKQLTHEAARSAVRAVELETLLAEHEAGHVANARRMEQHGIPLAWRPTRTAKAVANGGSKAVPLYELLVHKFNDSELYDLGFRVGIERDDIVGETHEAKVQCLIEYATRHDLIDDLIAAGRKVRPGLIWPDVNL